MQLNSEIPASDCLQKTEFHTIYTDVVTTIASSTAKITPLALEKILSARYGLHKKQIKTVIRNLVACGELTYTYEFGSTFLERSFTKPVRISRHVVLTPPHHSYRSKTSDVVVQIKSGAAFGVGNHPSTRLAIRAIEFVLSDHSAFEKKQKATVLDVGTGSGVLILTAILGGMDSGMGIDIDACARAEAAENVNINGLKDRVWISGQPLETVDHQFTMVLANLRFPSLRKLSTRLTEVTAKRGVLILSGIKNDEAEDLQEIYTRHCLKYMWSSDELGWVCIVLKKIE
jgi:ribosomal protein L11 methyltransferase